MSSASSMSPSPRFSPPPITQEEVEAFHKAIKAKDIEKVAALWSRKELLQTVDKEGNTALQAAAQIKIKSSDKDKAGRSERQRTEEIVEGLIKRGSKTSECGSRADGKTAFVLANENNPEIANMMLNEEQLDQGCIIS